MKPPVIGYKSVSKILLSLDMVISLVYLSWWMNAKQIGNPILYWLLVAGEVYRVFMAWVLWRIFWPGYNWRLTSLPPIASFHPSVDVYITVAGEPIEVIASTVTACRDMDYPNHKVYILNDGYVAHKENWKEVEELAEKLGVQCITRKVPSGAKAGNINNALKHTDGDLITIFDADMVPHKDFLTTTVPYFYQEWMGFVQSPQYYKNNTQNIITQASWDQQELFFGPIMRGKDKDNTVFICGTNVVIRRVALDEVGGMYEKSITEDVLTSLLIHQNKWISHFLPKVLAEGLAPQDMMSYYKQQFRWAVGSLAIVFNENPFFKRGLTMMQKLQYFTSAFFYINGVFVFIDMLMPLFYLFFSVQIVRVSTTSFAFFFLPYIFLNLYTLYKASDESLTFRALAMTHSSWFMQLQALFSVLLGYKIKFNVTPKTGKSGNYITLALPHLIYIMLAAVGSAVAIMREGLNPSVMINISWVLVNVSLFLPFIRASYNDQAEVLADAREMPAIHNIEL